MLVLFGLKNCDSCRKAMRALETSGIEFEFIDIRLDPPKKSALLNWLDVVGGETLVNTRSTTWRALSEDDRTRMKKDPAGLLHDFPTLIKRPVIKVNDDILVGWTPDVRMRIGIGDG